MKVFIVKATMTTRLRVPVMARDEEHAMEIAKDIDGGSFEEIDNAGYGRASSRD